MSALRGGTTGRALSRNGSLAAEKMAVVSGLPLAIDDRYPFTTATGTSRATLRAIPAPWTTSITRSTSL